MTNSNHKIMPKEFSIQIDNLRLNIYIDSISLADNADYKLTTSLHIHPYTEIFICKSGTLQIATIDDIVTLSPGDAAFIPSGIKHFRTPDTNIQTVWERIGFLCTKRAMQNTKDLFSFIVTLANQKKIIVYQHNQLLYDIVSKMHIADENQMMPLIFNFLAELFRLSQTPIEQNAADDSSSKFKNIDLLIQLQHIIDYEFMNPLNNSLIAKQLLISERHLSRLVMKHYNTTPHNLVLQKRLDVARKLLHETKDTVENIALTVGFENKSSFYKEFKKKFHMTPMQYRQMS